LAEETKHRLHPDEAHVKAVRILAGLPMRADQICARDRLQLPGALVKRQLDEAERLEPPPETRAGLTDALGHGPHATPGERVQMEDAIRLAEAERAEHNRVRPIGPRGHRPSLEGPLRGAPGALKPDSPGRTRFRALRPASSRWSSCNGDRARRRARRP